MKNKELDILERAFCAQIDYDFGNGFGIIQTKSKVAKQLAEDGFLKNVQIRLGGNLPVTIEGYALTLQGNLTYCTSDRCKRDE
jgi:hypothetical protein